jgi:hypothetical protein
MAENKPAPKDDKAKPAPAPAQKPTEQKQGGKKGGCCCGGH